MISDLKARKIASEWYGGQWTPLYALSSSGAIVNQRHPDFGGQTVKEEIFECLMKTSPDREKRRLMQLWLYVDKKGPRAPVEGWSELRW